MRCKRLFPCPKTVLVVHLRQLTNPSSFSSTTARRTQHVHVRSSRSHEHVSAACQLQTLSALGRGRQLQRSYSHKGCAGSSLAPPEPMLTHTWPVLSSRFCTATALAGRLAHARSPPAWQASTPATPCSQYCPARRAHLACSLHTPHAAALTHRAQMCPSWSWHTGLACHLARACPVPAATSYSTLTSV